VVVVVVVQMAAVKAAVALVVTAHLQLNRYLSIQHIP
jgi:hypothetical protein